MESSSTGVKRILIVEDELAICDLCQRVLTNEDFEVDIAVNGKIAQDMIEEQQYALYLIDIRLPVMTGMELYQHISEKHPELAERVIFTTGSVIGRDTQSFLEQSGRAFLLKPFTPDELKAVEVAFEQNFQKNCCKTLQIPVFFSFLRKLFKIFYVFERSW